MRRRTIVAVALAPITLVALLALGHLLMPTVADPQPDAEG